MSVNHWTEFLTEPESCELDSIELEILRLKDETRELAAAKRRLLCRGTKRLKKGQHNA